MGIRRRGPKGSADLRTALASRFVRGVRIADEVECKAASQRVPSPRIVQSLEATHGAQNQRLQRPDPQDTRPDAGVWAGRRTVPAERACATSVL